MLLWTTLILIFGAIVADIIYYRRLRRRTSRPRARLFAVWAALTGLLPFAGIAVGLLAHDNTTPIMHLMMWMLWGWMVTVLPRMIYYLFAAMRLRRVGIAAGLCVVLLLVWGATIGRTDLKISSMEIRSERLPAGFDGLRVVQFADLHLGTLVNPRRETQRLVNRINSLRPDLIVFSGDLVNISCMELDTAAQGILSNLKATYGVVSVLGNHDVGAYIRDTAAMPRERSRAMLIARQQQMGWRVLQDSTVWIHRLGDSIAISGIDYDATLRDRRHDATLPPFNQERVYRGVPDSAYDITAVHLPQLWDQILESGHGDLSLAGHVHSMQMKIDLFGWKFSPAKLMYDRWSGRYDLGGRTLSINDGIGYVGFPMRLGARPEITLIILKR